MEKVRKFSKGLKRGVSVSLIAVTALGLTACGNRKTTGNGDGDTLTYWMKLPGNIATSVANYAETPFAKEYMKRTGIEVTYTHPAQGQEDEALNLLLASGNLPDIIETDWIAKNPDSMIQKNIIQSLNDVIDTKAPNLKKFLSENPEIDRDVKTDSGNYYAFPFIRNGEKLLNISGLMIRDDWMRELNLEYPETIDEWEKVLTEFKEKKGAKCPLVGDTWTILYFTGGYGIADGFYVDNGKIKYGTIESGFGKFLETMNRWYKNGLIDKNFATIDTKYKNTCILDGSGGAAMGAGGSGMGAWITGARANGNSGYSLKATKALVEKRGDLPRFTTRELKHTPKGDAAITRDCKNVDAAVKFLDYSYSDEGAMLNNFGIEGESYTMEDGNPKYTENIVNNAEGLPMSQMLTMYARSSAEGPFVQDERYIEQYYQLPEQQDALNTWSINDAAQTKVPQLTLTEEEKQEYSSIMTDFNTFRDENILAFIMGTRPISEFDTFVQECKDRKIERAVEIYQTAYDRYLNRK